MQVDLYCSLSVIVVLSQGLSLATYWGNDVDFETFHLSDAYCSWAVVSYE